MFRKMRRFKQELSQKECERILNEGTTCTVALHGDDGYTYAVPLNYLYHNGKIYFHGANTGHKFDALMSDEKISICVIEMDTVLPEKLSTSYRSVIAFGRARLLTDEKEIYENMEAFGLRYNDDIDVVHKGIENEWKGLACFELEIDHMSGKESRNLMKERNK